MRMTSILAYNELVENGGLAEANAKVYKHLFHNGPTTQKKTERALGDRTYTMRPRFAQLEKMGLIMPCGYIVCEETNVKNMLWDVTDRITPLPVKSSKSKKKTLEEVIERLKELRDKCPDMFIKHDLDNIISITNNNKT